MSASQLSQQPDAPSRRSITYWKKAVATPVEERKPPKKRGFKRKLSDGEEQVVGGWVLEQVASNMLAQGEDVIAFVNESFHETISASYVTRMMQRIHFSSHLMKEKEQRRIRRGLMFRLLTFILNSRRTMGDDIPLSRIVAIDIAKFGHFSHILRSYAPSGG